MSKNILLHMDCPADRKPYFLAPVGKYLNRSLDGVRPGDMVTFQHGWRREKRKLVRLCRIRINSPVFSFMIRSLYGSSTTILDVVERWRNDSVLQGYGKDGADTEICVLGEVENINC